MQEHLSQPQGALNLPSNLMLNNFHDRYYISIAKAEFVILIFFLKQLLIIF